MRELVAAFVRYVPSVLGALAVVAAGFVLAALGRRAARFALRRADFDGLCERSGITGLLGESVRRTPTDFAGLVVFYGVLIFAVLAALGPLGLDFLATALNQVVLYIPRVLAAALALVLGTSAAGLVSEMVGRSLGRAEVGGAGSIQTFTRFATLFVVAILAAAILQIDVTILIVLTVVALGGVALTAALAVGLGLGGLSSNVAAGRYLSEGVSVGDEIHLGEIFGTVEEIGHAMTKVRAPDGALYLVPNSCFLHGVVQKPPECS